MPRVDTKWKEYKGEKLVALKEPRRVSRVGYKVHRGLAKFHFLKEMDDRIAFGPEDEAPDIDPCRIVGNHPKMAPYMSVRDTIREALAGTLQERGAFAVEPHRAIDKMMERLDRSVIRELVEQTYNALKAKEKEPPRREIHFTSIIRDEFFKDGPHPDWWRGPWEVSGWKKVYTGTYSAGYSWRGYGDEDGDYEPPGLVDRKAHVLLKAWKVNERLVGGFRSVVLLKEDTYPWDCEKWARIFAEQK